MYTNCEKEGEEEGRGERREGGREGVKGGRERRKGGEGGKGGREGRMLFLPVLLQRSGKHHQRNRERF